MRREDYQPTRTGIGSRAEQLRQKRYTATVPFSSSGSTTAHTRSDLQRVQPSVNTFSVLSLGFGGGIGR